MATLPNDVTDLVMKDAIAWNMVEAAIYNKAEYIDVSPEERMKLISKLFKEAYNTVRHPGK